MIRRTDAERFRAFAEAFFQDGTFYDPMLYTDRQRLVNFYDAVGRDGCDTFGVFDGDTQKGLFVFLKDENERYAEMLACFARGKTAYGDMLTHLQKEYAGYGVDFVIDPQNTALRGLLKAAGAAEEPEQKKMIFSPPAPPVTDPDIILYRDAYRDEYLALHDDDRYWTGEKVLAASDRFRVVLALRDGHVAGYLDITYAYPENEPYDVFVVPSYRSRGLGTKMLSFAAAKNENGTLSLLADVDDKAVCRVAEKAHFLDTGLRSVALHLEIK